MKTLLKIYSLCALAALISAGNSINPAMAATFRTVALTTDPAAQPVGLLRSDLIGAEFENLLVGVKLNNLGQVVFNASVNGPDITPFENDRGTWSEGSGSLALVYLSGDQAPGTPFGTGLVSGSNGNQINDSGDVAFRSLLAGAGVTEDNGLGVLSESAGALGLVARAGEHAPGTPGGVVYRGVSVGFGVTAHINEPSFNHAGQTAFSADLDGPGVSGANDFGIWSEGTGSLSLVARTGQQAIGLLPGVNHDTLSGTPTLNSAGQVAYSGRLEGVGVVEDVNDWGLWTSGPVSNELVVRSGTAAPGTTFGTNFKTLGSAHINASNDIAFRGTLSGLGVDSTNDLGIWSEGSGILPGSIGLVARKGDHAPGAPAGINFGTLLSPAFNAEGETAFVADLTGVGIDSTNDRGLWSEGFGDLSLVAREGDHAPGTDPGVVFSTLDPGIPSMNASGQVAFKAVVSGPGVDASNDNGIWAQDEDGILQLIVREGDSIPVFISEIGAFEFRTIDVMQFISSTGDDDGRAGGFNDLGQIAFSARFTDGSSGVFVTELAGVVPEPGALLLLVLGGALMGTRRHAA